MFVDAQPHSLPEADSFAGSSVAARNFKFSAQTRADVCRVAAAGVHAGVVHVRDQCVAALFCRVPSEAVFFRGYVLVGFLGRSDYQRGVGGVEFADGDGKFKGDGAAQYASAVGFGSGREWAGD